MDDSTFLSCSKIHKRIEFEVDMEKIEGPWEQRGFLSSDEQKWGCEGREDEILGIQRPQMPGPLASGFQVPVDFMENTEGELLESSLS